MQSLEEAAFARRGRLPRLRLSLSSAILVAMVLGVLTGIVFGELVAPLEVVGTAFIKLLQMTILPYITVSLIAGIGGLTYDNAKMLATRAGVLMLLYWVIAFVFVVATPLAFPHLEAASFFSASLVETPEPVNFLDIYIPANPFHSLSFNYVPAVVVFSIAIGVALIGNPRKHVFLPILEVLADSLVKIAGFVVKLTPIGVFAIAASAAGTMTVHEFERLQVYLISFTVLCLILTFWVLPAIIAAATPFRYRDVVGISRDALVTAFTTGNLFVVLALLTNNGKQLFARYGMTKEHTDAYVDVIIPVTFNFPNVGKLIMLSFILFAGWFSGNPLTLDEYPRFIVSGLLSFFGGVDVALPFMLDQMHIPPDLYQLYMVTGIINGRTATLLAAMNLLTFTLLATAAMTGYLHVDKRKAILVGLVSLGLLAASTMAMRWYFEGVVADAYDKDRIMANMQLLEHSTESKVHSSVPKDLARVDPAEPVLPQVLERGVLRVGYNADNLPWSFFNASGELVGFDMDMAHLLAQELGLKLEFVPFQYDTLAKQLARNDFDLVMSGIPATTDLLTKMTFSDPYMEVNVAFVFKDLDRKQFLDLNGLRELRGIKVGLNGVRDSYYRKKIEQFLPNLEVVELDSDVDFFTGKDHGADALLTNAETGSAWTLLFPSYTVAVPKPKVGQPIAYPVAAGDQRFADFLGHWVLLKKQQGTFKTLYDHWILGLTAEQEKPRWSLVRNVFHWVD